MISDEDAMRVALEEGSRAIGTTSPRPWVGALLVTSDGEFIKGHTQPNAGAHAESVVLAVAGKRAQGGTLYTTLEPCSHYGSNPPCVQSILDSRIDRVVVGVRDPDGKVAGAGIRQLDDAGVEITVGVLEREVSEQLRAYLHHRSTGRPYVVLKLAMTIDGRLAAPDGTSQWITGVEARHDVQKLRAASDAVIVGSGTVRHDDPSLTVRDITVVRQPQRIVLGAVPDNAKVLPARTWHGPLVDLVNELGSEGCLQVLVEGGADVAGQFHRSGLVDEYWMYVAPALLGGNDGVPVMRGSGASTMADVWRGRVVSIERLGDDVKLVVRPQGVE